jgi:hypothetical protein
MADTNPTPKLTHETLIVLADRLADHAEEMAADLRMGAQAVRRFDTFRKRIDEIAEDAIEISVPLATALHDAVVATEATDEPAAR